MSLIVVRDLRRRILRWFGNGLIATGSIMLVVTGGLVLYSQYEEYKASQEAALFVPPDAVYSTVTPLPTRPSTATPISQPVAVNPFASNDAQEGVSRVIPTSTETPAPPTFTPTPVAILPPERMVASSIGLDTKVVESHIVNGEWQVPKFVAVHLEGTSMPLAGGNIVLSGHVQSLSSGNVFAKMGSLHVGDSVRIYTKTAVITYVVAKINVVSNKDVSVIRPTPVEQLTLITCAGTWLPLQRDYDSRLVVVASRQA